MLLNQITTPDGLHYVTWEQKYDFLDADGLPVRELQNQMLVDGQISVKDLQANHPDILNALTTIWNFLDSEIRRQEGLD